MNATTIHKFEAAGLGLAPFRYVGCYEDRGPHRSEINGVTVEVGAPGQPMGTCAYCGQGIALCFQIRSSDGRTFVVGSDCVEKTGDRGLQAVKNDARKMARAAQLGREETRIAAAQALLALDGPVARALAAKPHTHAYRASLGETQLDATRWLFECSGHSGKMRATRAVERLAKELGC